MRRISIRFSDALFKEMKLKLLDENSSVQAYLVELVKNDLGFTREESPEDYMEPRDLERIKAKQAQSN